MGRFYKTGKGDYIDFIYKQPRNLLHQAVKTAEGQIDQQAKLLVCRWLCQDEVLI